MSSPNTHVLRIVSHPDTARRPTLVLSTLKIFFPMDAATHYFYRLEKGHAADVQFGRTRSDLAILRRGLQAQGFIIEVIDLDFENFHGVEILQHAAAITGQFRTIVLSMHGEAHLVRRAMDLGAFGYVTKSRGARELVAAIHEVHKGHFYLTDDIRNQVANTPPHITKREREVLMLLISGETAKAIGIRLGISDKTVYIHRASLMEKFSAKTLIELGRKARDAGI